MPTLKLKDLSKISSFSEASIFEVLHRCLSHEVPVYAFTSAYFVDPLEPFFGECDVRTDSTDLRFPLHDEVWRYVSPSVYKVTTELIESIIHLELQEFGATEINESREGVWDITYSPHTYTLKLDHLIGVLAPDSPFDIKFGYSPKAYRSRDLYIRNQDIPNLKGDIKTPNKISNDSDYTEKIPDINLKKLHGAIIDVLIKALKEDASAEKIDHTFKLKDFLNDSNSFNSKALARSVHEDSIKYFQNADQYKVNTIAEKINDILKKFEK